MPSLDSTALNSNGLLLRLRIRPSEAAFNQASPSGKPDSPACSMVFPVEKPPFSLFPFFTKVYPSVARACRRECLHMIGSIRVRSLGEFPSANVGPRQLCPERSSHLESNWRIVCLE